MSNSTQIAQRNPQSVTEQKGAGSARRDAVTPAVDIVEDEHGILLYADLPGVDKADLDIKVHDGKLFLEAEASLAAPTGLTMRHAEIAEPFYARSFTLSADLDTSKIEAALEDGVLRLTIPRKEETRPRRIEITGA
jgi:HSP20 family molecular chaperone IbpA